MIWYGMVWYGQWRRNGGLASCWRKKETSKEGGVTECENKVAVRKRVKKRGLRVEKRKEDKTRKGKTDTITKTALTLLSLAPPSHKRLLCQHHTSTPSIDCAPSLLFRGRHHSQKTFFWRRGFKRCGKRGNVHEPTKQSPVTATTVCVVLVPRSVPFLGICTVSSSDLCLLFSIPSSPTHPHTLTSPIDLPLPPKNTCHHEPVVSSSQ